MEQRCEIYLAISEQRMRRREAEKRGINQVNSSDLNLLRQRPQKESA